MSAVTISRVNDHAASERGELAASAADALTSAFFDDPVWNYMARNVAPARKRDMMTWLWQRIVNISRRVNLLGTFVALDSSKVALGAAIWWPPGDEMSLADVIKAGYLLLPFKLGLAGFVSMVKTMDLFDQLHANFMSGRAHAYLNFVGVAAHAQGRGVGSFLMKRVLDALDRAQLAAYLESSNVKNLPFYVRHGFKIVHEAKALPDGPSIFCLIRDCDVDRRRQEHDDDDNSDDNDDEVGRLVRAARNAASADRHTSPHRLFQFGVYACLALLALIAAYLWLR
jgi:ribosomal protein S18 acetylase RimI-like enzyme